MNREAGASTGRRAVRVEGDCLVLSDVALCDAELAAYVGEHAKEDQEELVRQGLRVGLIALRNAGATVNIDYVAREFELLLQRLRESNDKAADALTAELRANFATEDGRLPRTLERYLGDEGTLHHLIQELFDEERRDSAIGRMRTLLAGYFDGDGATLARMLDPRREDSPLHGFRVEMREALGDVCERLVRFEAAHEARAAERELGSAKGGDFEERVGARLAAMLRGTGDVVEATGTTAGDDVRCRKGDHLITLDPSWTRGLTVRVAVEAKSGRRGLAAVCGELDQARRNRGAAVAVAVFLAGKAPAGCAPFTLHGEHVICELDPDDPADPGFAAAIRLARALALASVRSHGDLVDTPALRRDLDAIRAQLAAIRGMKSKLTSVSTATREVSDALDTMRLAVLDHVASIESNFAEASDAPREVA